jgi:hypothetical protein
LGAWVAVPVPGTAEVCAASLNHIACIAEAEAEGLAGIMAVERKEKIITIRKQPAVTISEDQKLSI